jgi:hypothetical protein
MIKLPETTTDQILLCFTLMVGSFTASMIIMGFQGKPTPPEFKESALFIGGGVFGALAAKRLSG